MAGVQGNHQEKGLRTSGLCCVGLLLVSLLAVLPATAPAAITEFTVPTANSQPAGITVGPDGALWFTEENGHKIGRITTDGPSRSTRSPPSPAPRARSPPVRTGICGSPSSAPIRPRSAGSRPQASGLREWELPLGSGPDGITAGPDGAIWFTENGADKIGRITLDGIHLDRVRPVPAERIQARGHHAGARRAALVHRIRGPQGRRDQTWGPTGDRGVRLSRKRSFGHRRLRRLDLVHDARPGQGRPDLHGRSVP